MTVTVDLENGPAAKAPGRLTLKLAAALLFHGGRFPHADAVAVAEAVRTGNRSLHRMVADAMRPLMADGVVVRRDDTWYAPSLADLGAWLADGLDYRDRAGLADDPAVPPAIPQPRAGSRAAA